MAVRGYTIRRGVEIEMEAPAVTVLADELRTAAKAHRCAQCGDTITTGQRYRRVAWVEDGDFYSSKQHQQCGR